jgi:hypothetical protein
VWLEALSLCTKDMWMNDMKHCEQIIRDDWVKCMGACSVDNCPPFIINLGSDSDSEYAFEHLDSDFELNDKTDTSNISLLPSTNSHEAELDSELITIIVESDDENEYSECK